MVKCVVSGCPNRSNVNPGIYNHSLPSKRFFNFPADTARVKVWLAALRETEKQDSAEQNQICEDHFLPEDISTDGVKGDAIPIMPPCLEGPLGVINPWGAASSEEEEDCDQEEDDEEDGGLMYVVPPAPTPPPKQAPVVKNSPAAKTTRGHPRKSSPLTKPSSRYNLSLGLLTQRFLELLLAAPDGVVDLGHVTTSLQTRRRRVYDITAVLEGISVLKRQSVNRFKWIGSTSISSFLWQNQQKLQRELDSLKLVEDTLDSLIKSCAQQLFSMTDDLDNATSAYVTHEDVGRLAAFQQQTVIVVKAPEETKLEVPAPKEDNIQVHLKGGRGPIMVLTCEVGGADASRHFLALEESRITTNTLHTESSNPQCRAECIVTTRGRHLSPHRTQDPERMVQEELH